jgi:hypothetical protein
MGHPASGANLIQFFFKCSTNGGQKGQASGRFLGNAKVLDAQLRARGEMRRELRALTPDYAGPNRCTASV